MRWASAGPPGVGAAAPGGRRREADADRHGRRAAGGARDGPRTVKELGELGAGLRRQPRAVGRPRPRAAVGTWERRRADRLGLAEDWVGPRDATEDEGLSTSSGRTCGRSGRRRGATSRRGPGSPSTDARRGGEGSPSSRYRDEDGRRAGRPARRAAARPGHAGAGAVPAALGRQPARPRPADGILPGGLPAARLQHEEPVLGRDLPRRRVGGRRLVAAGRPDRAGPVTRSSTTARRRAVEREREALEAFHA